MGYFLSLSRSFVSNQHFFPETRDSQVFDSYYYSDFKSVDFKKTQDSNGILMISKGLKITVESYGYQFIFISVDYGTVGINMSSFPGSGIFYLVQFDFESHPVSKI